MNRSSQSVPVASPPPVRARRPPTGSSPQDWRPPTGLVLACALLVGIMMSARMLFQPFVWRNWPWDDVLLAWLRLAGQHVAVALTIALALLGAWRLPARSAAGRAGLLAASIAIGATAADAVLAHFGMGGEPAFWRRPVQWSVVSASVAGMFYLWRHGSDVRDAAQAATLWQAQSERQRVVAQLQALRSQIEPHFLFNTLATLRSLQRSDPDQGGHLVGYILAYLRATGPGAVREDSTLGDELALVRAYLGVVSVRMPGRLVVEIDVATALLGCEMPALVIATLVENAIKHGLAPAPAGGRLSVTAQRHVDALEVCVADTGVGFGGGVAGSGLGLANVSARLQTLYGPDGSLRLCENKPHGVRASIRLPLRAVEAAA